jgi:Zn-dependent membrane protease YugP
MLLDSDYYLLVIPPLVLCLWAQWRIVAARRAAARRIAASGLSGGQTAEAILETLHANGVEIEPVSGQLANHYDASRKQLRLSHKAFAGRSLAALGLAAHEAGHALQHLERFPGLYVRNVVVPAASLSSTVVWVLILTGLLYGIFRLFVWGVFAFWIAIGLQLLNVPIERDASKRARHRLLAGALVTPGEEPVLTKVMNATDWTYVAATLTSFLATPFQILRSVRSAAPRREEVL